MRLRHTARVNDREVAVVVKCADTARVEGKYLVGIQLQDPRALAVVFDDSCAFHRDIAFRYSLRPLGGGWCVLDHARKQINAGGRSHAYGVEPGRNLVLEALGSAFPGYTVLPLE